MEPNLNRFSIQAMCNPLFCFYSNITTLPGRTEETLMII